jgi:adenosylmethionine-8-amino-7-oxononanoate aminotransferase
MREEGGVITRFVGDQIVLAPPLVINADEIDLIVGAVEAAVAAVTN